VNEDASLPVPEDLAKHHSQRQAIDEQPARFPVTVRDGKHEQRNFSNRDQDQDRHRATLGS
jgi:hypothetical protein